MEMGGSVCFPSDDKRIRREGAAIATTDDSPNEVELLVFVLGLLTDLLVPAACVHCRVVCVSVAIGDRK